jgi:hypothetical protein
MSIVLNSNVLRVANNHRIRRIENTKETLNGDDVTLLMRDITLVWHFVLQPGCMTDKFFSHMKSRDPNLANPHVGNYQKIVLIIDYYCSCAYFQDILEVVFQIILFA